MKASEANTAQSLLALNVLQAFVCLYMGLVQRGHVLYLRLRAIPSVPRVLFRFCVFTRNHLYSVV